MKKAARFRAAFFLARALRGPKRIDGYHLKGELYGRYVPQRAEEPALWIPQHTKSCDCGHPV